MKHITHNEIRFLIKERVTLVRCHAAERRCSWYCTFHINKSHRQTDTRGRGGFGGEICTVFHYVQQRERQ